MSEAPKSQRRTLLILAALFFVPLAASFLLYYGVGWRPSGGTNHGELLQPIRQLPEGSAGLLDSTTQPHNWALVYVGDGACDEDCKLALVFARQVRLMLGKEMTRVNWGLLASTGCCDLAYLDREHKGIKVFDVSEPAALEELLDVLPTRELRHSLFVIDPLGNIVMRYDVRNSPGGLRDDLKKLLKFSHIG
jgi:hypothetical protein